MVGCWLVSSLASGVGIDQLVGVIVGKWQAIPFRAMPCHAIARHATLCEITTRERALARDFKSAVQAENFCCAGGRQINK